MSENEWIGQIEGIADKATSVVGALSGMEMLLSQELGSATLMLRPAGAEFSSLLETVGFFESREFPVRGMYTARIESSGKPAGTLIACFGTWGAPSQLLRAATSHIAEQVAKLLRRGVGSPSLEAA